MKVFKKTLTISVSHEDFMTDFESLGLDDPDDQSLGLHDPDFQSLGLDDPDDQSLGLHV